MRGKLHRHEFDQRDGVGGLPWGDGCVENELFRGPAPQSLAVDFGQAGVDAIGIGLECRQCLGVLHGNRLARERVEVETAQGAVDLDGAGAEHL